MKYKVERDGEVWSLGYPTKSAATAAARRLNQTVTMPGRFTVSEMSGQDHRMMEGQLDAS